LFSLVSDMKTFSYIRRWTLHINHYNIINYLGIFNWYSIHPKNVWEAPYWDSFYLIKHKTSAVVIRKKNGKMQCADTDWLENVLEFTFEENITLKPFSKVTKKYRIVSEHLILLNFLIKMVSHFILFCNFILLSS